MTTWIVLVTSIPTANATSRMRAWRALKASGSAVLRDGVYLLPDRENCRAALNSVAADVLAAGGTALVLGVVPPSGVAFATLFDRSESYAELLADIARTRESLRADTAAATLKQTRKLRKTYAAIADIDYFPGAALHQAETALAELEDATALALSPDEPRAVAATIPRRQRADFQGRLWATRRRPWVDRLASAWLIRRFIDPDARLAWLASPADCPAEALGFDFDGAAFSHVGSRVTFEVLLVSFAIETPALERLAALVHYLDVGGVQPTEAGGVESVLAGLRQSINDDDQLLAMASNIFDGLLANFEPMKAPR